MEQKPLEMAIAIFQRSGWGKEVSSIYQEPNICSALNINWWFPYLFIQKNFFSHDISPEAQHVKKRRAALVEA